MSYTLSVWLDKKTENILRNLAKKEDRKLSSMVKVLIRKAGNFYENNQLEQEKEGDLMKKND